MATTPYPIDRSHDICYSPDDDATTGKGWYLQRFPDHATSQCFATEAEAIQALDASACVWDD